MKVARFHPFTGVRRELEIGGLTAAELSAWATGGVRIERAMPNVLPSDRETLITGLLPAERHSLIFGAKPSVFPDAPVGGTPVAMRRVA